MSSLSVRIYLLILLTLLTTGCGYSRMVKMNGDIENSWDQLEVHWKQRERLVQELLDITEGHNLPRGVLQESILKDREALASSLARFNKEETVVHYLNLQQRYNADISLLLASSSSYERIRRDVAYQALVQSFRDIDTEIYQSMELLKDDIHRYNRFISPFYRGMFGKWLGFYAYDDIHVQPEAYILLLPEEE